MTVKKWRQLFLLLSLWLLAGIALIFLKKIDTNFFGWLTVLYPALGLLLLGKKPSEN